MKNKIEDLRDHLFEVIEALKDADNPMDLERAKTVSAVAQTIINSAKVEIDAMRALSANNLATDFIPVERRGAGPLLPAPHRRD
ncbi:hypothetical protein KWH04_00990 [Xanthomonas campestris pv. trichodesmae]|uniref:Phage protein n=2 Tax=Xanthomonas citri TaxID=346 RepID=A0AB33CCE3_XANCI|nr:hypothetical protein [Xanthomonas citri]ASK91083.1 hypothetical protein XcvCFBP7111P_05820 [Xanthomonas citri pv. vignicola]MBV6779245.1 hypothetical protein [Xanthomonas campestris pv. trichodesmae]MBZ3921759.1 hypothetical protein [Xanthomonas campestris pv. trichodesmae]MBZ3926359.1 hypothetical protein [Xanthomonas citri pv. sesbaniae]